MSVHLDSKIVSQAPEDELARAVDQVKRGGFSYAVHPYVPPAERGGLEGLSYF